MMKSEIEAGKGTSALPVGGRGVGEAKRWRDCVSTSRKDKVLSLVRPNPERARNRLDNITMKDWPYFTSYSCQSRGSDEVLDISEEAFGKLWLSNPSIQHLGLT